MDLNLYSQLELGLSFVVALMLLLWIVQWFTTDASVVDVGWSFSLGLLALFYGVTLQNPSTRTYVITAMASIWSFRLGTYLYFDRVLGKSEDGRYQKLRADYGSKASVFFFVFFQAQALIAFIFSLTYLIAMSRREELDSRDLVGVIVWFGSIAGESISDAQLSRFRSNPVNKGRTCRTGLWRYSRHPNYFFEWLHWCSYPIIAWPTTFGWATLLAPMVMLFFLFKVTGIPTTEARALVSRKDDYREYQRTTSVFVPWFPKH